MSGYVWLRLHLVVNPPEPSRRLGWKPHSFPGLLGHAHLWPTWLPTPPLHPLPFSLVTPSAGEALRWSSPARAFPSFRFQLKSLLLRPAHQSLLQLRATGRPIQSSAASPSICNDCICLRFCSSLPPDSKLHEIKDLLPLLKFVCMVSDTLERLKIHLPNWTHESINQSIKWPINWSISDLLTLGWDSQASLAK